MSNTVHTLRLWADNLQAGRRSGASPEALRSIAQEIENLLVSLSACREAIVDASAVMYGEDGIDRQDWHRVYASEIEEARADLGRAEG